MGAAAEHLCRNAGPSEGGRPLPGAFEASGLDGGARVAGEAVGGGESTCTDHAVPKPHSGCEGEGA